ncbi:MAG: Fic family protein [Candidatus Liptonbacteria bacterium]|nr:Fic family protein [Candidatus Liptonbacteria bacterium]
MVIYVDPDDLRAIFEVVKDHFSSHESVPDFSLEKNGVEKLCGVLRGVQMDFYPTVIEKAAYLLVQISKGHFFSNGNKRVALATTLFFIFYNDHDIAGKTKKDYQTKLRELFPNYDSFHDFNDFRPEEYGYYNLSIIIAERSDKHVSSFDELKNKVLNFLEFSLIKN